MSNPNPTVQTAPLADATRAPRATTKELIRALGMLPVLVLLCVGFAVGTESFLSVQNFSIMAQQASINIVLATGMTFVILTAGIDLSVGSILAASAVVAMLVSKIPEFGMLGIVGGMACGLLFGLINGVLIAFVK